MCHWTHWGSADTEAVGKACGVEGWQQNHGWGGWCCVLGSQACLWEGLADHSLCVPRLHLPHKGVFLCLPGSQPSRWGSRRIKHRPAVYKYVVFFLACTGCAVPAAAAAFLLKSSPSSLPRLTPRHPPVSVLTRPPKARLPACVTNLVLEGSSLLDFHQLTRQPPLCWCLG